ncbi:MAG: HAD hydrolase family protein [Planctomycetota bacterium]
MVLDDAEFVKRAREIRLLITDVDGVLTDGSILLDEDGRELKQFHILDGFGVKSWQRAGHRIAVLSGRRSAAVRHRCLELDIDPVVQGHSNKIPAYLEMTRSLGVTREQVCFIGDDLPDLPLILGSGIGATVSTGVKELKERADWVSTRPGGAGALRELIEALLVAQGRWSEVVDYYSRSVDDE